MQSASSDGMMHQLGRRLARRQGFELSPVRKANDVRILVMIAALLLWGCPKTSPKGGADVSAEPTAALPPAPLPPDPLAPRVEVLPNGLTVMIAPNSQEPRFYSQIVVRAGSAQDPRDATGMAHYLEHLLANKGTQRLGTTDWLAEKPHLGEIRALYDALFVTEDEEERAGLYQEIGTASRAAAAYSVANELKQVYGLLGARSLNAFTSSDQTSYVVDLPANRLGAWSLLEGDRFAKPVFRSFQTEVETVYEEKNRALDQPHRALHAAFMAALYGDHPYGTTTLGEVAHLKNPSVSKTESFFKRWYVPGNMAVVLAGDLDPDVALDAVRSSLGRIPARRVRPIQAGDLPPIEGRVVVEITHRGQPGLLTGWQTVPVGHADAAALEVAAELLSNGSTGLLDTELVQAERVRGASAWVDQRRLAGCLGVAVRPRDGQTMEEAEALAIEQIERLAAGDFDRGLLAAVVRNGEVERARDLHSNRGRAHALGWAFVSGRSWEEERIALAALAAVTAEDVIRVATTWLTGDRVVALRRQGEPDLPQMLAPDLGPLPLRTDARSAMQDEVMALPAEPTVPQELTPGVDYSRASIPSGPLVLVKNPYDDLSSLTLRWYAGSRADPLLCDALGLWARAGAGDLDRTGFEARLYALASDVDVRCGRDSIAIVLRAPGDALAALLPLVEERLREPVLDPEEAAKYLADRVARRAQDRTTLDWATGALGAFALHGEDSGWLGGAPTDEQILSLQQADVAARTAPLLSARRTSLYSGPQGEFDVTRLLARPDVLYEALPVQAPLTFERPSGPRVLLLDHDSAQATVQVLVPDAPWSEDEYAVRRLWNEYVGGSAGLIFQEVRESRGWAYSARASYRSGWRLGDENLVSARIGTQPDKAADVAALVLGVLRSLPEDPARWSRSKSSSLEKLRSQRIPFNSVPATLEAWRLKGHDVDPRAERLRGLPEPSLEDVVRWATRFGEAPFTVAIVGDVERMDLGPLEELAPIERVELDAISR